MNKNQKISQSFAKGALIMALGMLFVKIMGAVFKVPLAYIIGGEGMGYFNGAYSLYNPIYAVATAGLPIAVSRMVSGDIARKRFKDVRKIHKISVPIFFCTGMAGFILMILGTFLYVKMAKAPGSVYSILMLAPTVLFSCLISIYKGYYEGLRNMIPTAVSEVIESVCKVIFGLVFALAVVKYGVHEYNIQGTVFGNHYDSLSLARSATLPFASAGAVLGITFGSVAGYLYMLITYKIQGDGIKEEELENSPAPRRAKTIIKLLFSVSTLVALGAIVMNFAGVLDATLTQRRIYDIMQTAPDTLISAYNGLIPTDVIERGTTHIFFLGGFGYMSTITMVLPAIVQGISISALPAVTAAWVTGARETLKKNIESILKMTAMISIPSGLGLSVLSYPIMDLVYNTVGGHRQPGEICIGAHVMSVSAVAVIFLCISTPICSMLQAVGRADLPVKILTVGMIIKVVLNYILVGIPSINIQGASFGTLVCYLFVFIAAFYCLYKESGISLDLKSIFFKPLIAGVFCACFSYFSHNLLSKIAPYKLSTVISIIIGCAIYIIFILILRTITRSDLKILPKSEKIIYFLEKHKLM
ncbi:MAG: polysaccharide biosynthesis protein [Oscillospiraceae bacterium]|jgi:stage V sporulation protein B|nr:polysaccharide biosynthesis protein [Oscillospiraceae bacterium]